jgi:hypothetical protein
MDILDIFLNKIAYKFPKGYPDMNNEQDILILESVIENMGLQEIFKQLSFFDLKKRGGYRFKDLASRVKNKIPFELTNGSSTALEFAKPEYQEAFEKSEEIKIRSFSPKDINSFPFFKDDAGKEYSISDLLKDPYIEAPWNIIESYFRDQHLERLVRHQLESYNNFVGYQIIKTIEMFNPVHIKSENDFDPKSGRYSLEMFINIDQC